tara:strand:+ start:2080 stop:3006 length:927 start_codon:yes stop_codon:yes gene_type:complete
MLKQFAGLLNEVAPQGEFLAYINDDEAKMLQDEGGMGILTEAGIPSYRSRAAQENRSRGASRTGSNTSARERGAAQDRDSGAKQYVANTTQSRRDDDRANFQAQRKDARQALIRNDPESFTNRVNRLIDQGGLTLSILGNVADLHNKKRRTSFIEGLDSQGMPRTRDFYRFAGRAYDPNKVLDKTSKEFEFLSDSGYFEQFKDMSPGESDVGQRFDNPADFTQQNLTTNVNPYSMVNQFFSGQNMGNLGISSAYMNTYNQAKANMAKSLNLTDTSAQFGYNANPFSNYSMSMTSSNPFYDELKAQGII